MVLNTKIALVTGGSRGLGKNMAIAIAKKGIDVTKPAITKPLCTESAEVWLAD